MTLSQKDTTIVHHLLPIIHPNYYSHPPHYFSPHPLLLPSLMEKAKDEMDFGDWDFVSHDGFLHEEVGNGKGLFLDPKGVFVVDYFNPNSRKKKQGVSPIPIQLDHKYPDQEVVKEVIKQDQDDDVVVSQSQQVSFKKTKGTEFVDMKMDSQKSGNRGIKTQIDEGLIQFEEKIENDHEEVEKDEKKKCLDSNIGGICIWKWRINGIGALRSIGMAAATICIFILSSKHRHKHHQQNQKLLRFQIYSDDKRFKHVVHHATKLNQVISSARGGPFNRAHFTYGGYYTYDGL